MKLFNRLVCLCGIYTLKRGGLSLGLEVEVSLRGLEESKWKQLGRRCVDAEIPPRRFRGVPKGTLTGGGGVIPKKIGWRDLLEGSMLHVYILAD